MGGRKILFARLFSNVGGLAVSQDRKQFNKHLNQNARSTDVCGPVSTNTGRFGYYSTHPDADICYSTNASLALAVHSGRWVQ
jgi:hypothetical protein